jgi:hypothetical protein
MAVCVRNNDHTKIRFPEIDLVPALVKVTGRKRTGRRTGKLPYKRTAAVNTATLTHDYLAIQPYVLFTLGADLSIFSVYRKEDFSYKSNIN